MSKKISGLSAATALTGPEEIPGVQSGGNVKVTAAQIKTWVNKTSIFYTSAGVEYARSIDDNGGSLLIGATSSGGSARLQITQPDANESTALFLSSAGTPSGDIIGSLLFTAASPDNNTAKFIACADATTDRLIVYSDGDVQNHDNSYGAISDAKLKQDIADSGSQWDDIRALRLRKYRFKSDFDAKGEAAPLLLGLVAQEAELVSPGLVEDYPDTEYYEEAPPVLDGEGRVVKPAVIGRRFTGTATKGLKYSILYLKAVGALQEAMARIEALEGRVAALEAKA